MIDGARDAQDAVLLDVWLADLLSRWWQLPGPIRHRLCVVFAMEIASPGSRIQDEPRTLQFSIDDEQRQMCTSLLAEPS